jgi:RHS repeat-associated protein
MKIISMLRSMLAAALVVAGCGAQANTITYYHNDAAGTPLAATSSSGQVVWRESYRPYGERRTNSAAANGNDVWFTSRRQDESGLVYMGARYYDPVLGRFLSTDPRQFDGADLHSHNRYAYANNNPLKFSDPDGGNPILIAMGIGAVVGGGINATTQYLTTGTVRWSGIGGVFDAAGDGMLFGLAGGAVAATEARVGGEVIRGGIGRQTSSNPVKGIESLRERVAEHRQKLQDYIKNPDAYDNQDVLKNAPTPEIRQKMIEGRVRKLESEIRGFEKGIKDLGGDP